MLLMFSLRTKSITLIFYNCLIISNVKKHDIFLKLQIICLSFGVTESSQYLAKRHILLDYHSMLCSVTLILEWTIRCVFAMNIMFTKSYQHRPKSLVLKFKYCETIMRPQMHIRIRSNRDFILVIT